MATEYKCKARHSATTVAVQWEGKWVNKTNTRTCLSSFWAVFQCAFILSRKTTKPFMKPRIYDSMVGTVQ